MTKAVCIATLAIFFSFSAAANTEENSQERIHVVLLNSADESHWFWKMITDFSLAAANDLGINLEVMYNEPKMNHLLTIRQAKQVVNRPQPPDYILTGNEKGSAAGVIKAAQQAEVKVFLFSNGFVTDKAQQKYGQPREKYEYWIGKLIPNNFSAGYQMGKVLIQQSLEKALLAPDGRLHIAAIAGAFNTHASTERVRGLRAAVNEYQDQVTLVQVVPGDWSEKTAARKAKYLLDRFPDVGAVWAVNDSSAIGAMSSAVSIGKTPGKDILFVGCGWGAAAIQKVKQGALTATVGGHFMEGAWSLVMIYDYHHGKDFNHENYQPEMYSIDRTNVDQFITVFSEQDWSRIDFRQFSKVYNPKQDKYDFSLDAVLRQFR